MRETKKAFTPYEQPKSFSTLLLYLHELQARYIVLQGANEIKTKLFHHQVIFNNIFQFKRSDLVSVQKVHHFGSSGEKRFLMSQ